MQRKLIRCNDIEAFKAYCRSFRSGLDESYLYDEDLDVFQLSDDNPTTIMVDSKEQIIGVASLIVQDYINGKKRGRIRMVHAISGKRYDYDLLFDALKRDMVGLDHIYGFVDEKNHQQLEAFKANGFTVDRYSWVLTRPPIPIEAPVFPEGFMLRNFEYYRDEWAYLKVRNAAFADVKGSETPQTLESLRAFREESTHMEGGIQMLWKGEEPVGLIRIFKETEDGVDYAFVAPIAIDPAYHGLGLGRLMLRAGIYFGQQHYMAASMLCVNAENEKAAGLYLQEGYEKSQVMVCLRYTRE